MDDNPTSQLNYIALAVPFFFLFIGVEALAARRRGKDVYRFSDSITDLGCGVASRLSEVLFHGALAFGYIYIYQHRRLFELSPRSPLTWVFTFFAVDLIYYWWHRLSHEVNFLWAAHVVHHSSEDYNLAVALRQAITTSFTFVPFFFPLALLGVPPLVYLTIHSFNILYQFWIHTQLVGTLGPVEKVLNTPSQHRVHHAINVRYLDKNYGGTLTIWDRLFGTFEPETEPCVYGIVKPLNSYNPFWAQFHYWFELIRMSRQAPRMADKLAVWWKSPAWHPEGLPGHPLPEGVTPENFTKYDPAVSLSTKIYVSLHFALALVATFLLMLWQDRCSLQQTLVGTALILMTLLSASALFEDKRWARPLEVARLVLVATAISAHFIQGSPLLAM